MCALIARGNTRTDACACAGISYMTIKLWLRLGQRAREAGKRDKYLTFLTAVEKAKGECRKRLVACVWKAAAKNWRAAAYLLGCKAPDEYGPFLHVLKEIRKDVAEMKKAHADANPPTIPPPSPPPQGDPPAGG
jgi:hypothetical protein